MNMEVDASKVVSINSDDDDVDTSDKPIIQLFKKLTKESNQKTVLTNAQIVNILKEEFNIDIWDIHELEGDIYITLMKMYLKDWPLWEEFDKVVKNLKNKNDNRAMDKVLLSNYTKLKEHLKTMLDSAKEEAANAVQRIKDGRDDTDKTESNVVLELTASRAQLNKLFFRRPLPKLNNTIFNSTKHVIPTQITVNKVPIETILNWWGVNISIKIISSKISLYERHTKHDLKHVLVNKNLMLDNTYEELDQELKVRVVDPTKRNISEFIDILNDLSQPDELEEIYEFIKRDLGFLPEETFTRARFRRYTNKYPYVRYLYQEVKQPDLSSRKYDIQLQETIAPMYEVYLRVTQANQAILVVECEGCSLKFLGPLLLQELRAHFNEFHLMETDWDCTKCKKTFPMAELAQNWWCHRCS